MKCFCFVFVNLQLNVLRFQMNLFSFLAMMMMVVVGVNTESMQNSLVNCAACQTVQLQVDNWSCDVNCQVIQGQNGEYVFS